MKSIEFDIKGVGSLIRDTMFTVPNYQRPYKWEEEHISNMLYDIENAINVGDSEYFLGTIVLSCKVDTDFLEIVDGQQRITTVSIFLCALRNYFKDLNETEISSQINNDYISRYDIRSKEAIPKLELSIQDRGFFDKYIVDKSVEAATKGSHERIIKAYEICKAKISNITSDSRKELIHDWIDFIKDSLKVVIITVPSEMNAFIIFETLNDRGLILAQIDLLKNYLFSKASKRKLDEIEAIWLELSAKIESETDENLLLKFIKHFWSSKHGLTREGNKELYKKIIENVKTQSQVYDFIKDLSADSRIYLAIHNHNDVFWDDYTIKTRNYVETLNFFGLEQYKPLLLAILKKFKPPEVEKSLKIIVSWLVRNLITGSLGGGSLEKEYTDRSKEISEGVVTNAKQFRDRIKVIPEDNEFKNKFITASVSKDKYARYYLAVIENMHRKTSDPELLVNTNIDAVNLEHILPKTPQSNWTGFTPDQVKTLHKKIGNLTLMKSKLNSKLGNASFIDKVATYKSSELFITKMISDYTEWDEDSITDRQSKLADIAVKAWSLKFD